MKRKKWLLRVGFGLFVIVAAAGTWAGLNATVLQARYTAYQFRTATTDEQRSNAADRLIALGDPGLTQLLEHLRSSDDAGRAAVVAALTRYLDGLPDGDQRAVTVAGQLLQSFPEHETATQQAILELLPVVLKSTGNTYALKCREAVAIGLAMPDVPSRLHAVRLAIHPDIKMRANLVPMLAASEPEIRRTVLFAVASLAEGEPLLSDEDLFRWLHDPDESVRKTCLDALVNRDRTETEIQLGRRLTHPDASERLKLLMDLRYDDDVNDPEPWLERLARDPEPAVRVGAVRVAMELSRDPQQSRPPWITPIATTDPDPTVRRITTFLQRNSGRAPASGIRTVGGP